MGDTAESIWVVGFGTFGRRAVDLLRRETHAPAHCTVIDPLVDGPGRAAANDGLDFVRADGVRWLVDNFTHRASVKWIVPALPVHLAARWLEKKLAGDGKVVEALPVSAAIVDLLPNACRLSDADWAVSHADFICPADCSEPDDICTCTGATRPQPLYDLLAALPVAGQLDAELLIIRSHQLAPGVGGVSGNELWGLFERLRQLEGTPLLIGTACKCHGILSSFRFTSRK